MRAHRSSIRRGSALLLALALSKLRFSSGAVSTGQRNKLGEFLNRHHIVERLAGTSVEASLNPREVVG